MFNKMIRNLIFMEPVHINRKARQGEGHTSQVDETPLYLEYFYYTEYLEHFEYFFFS